MDARPRFKCFFTALIFAWVISIYLPSALIALAGLSPLASSRSFPAATFEVADEVAPAAKIGFIFILAPLLFARERLLGHRLSTPGSMMLACAAMLLTLAFLPQDYSRGFGIGLTGDRFAIAPLAIYLASAALAGLVFSLSNLKCRARNYPEDDNSTA